MSIVCVRCGRVQGSVGSDREHRESHPRESGATGTWALFGEGDVCPDCQSPREQYEIKTRIAAIIEAEIRRRTQRNVDPDEREAPLVDLAMDMRTHSTDPTDADVGAEQNRSKSRPYVDGSASAANVEASDGRAFLGAPWRIAVTGAFLTGSPIPVHLETYAEAQKGLSQKLRAPNWSIASSPSRPGTFQSGGGFTTTAPLVIARRNGADLLAILASALKEVRRAEASGPLDQTVSLTLEPDELTVDVYDLGVGVLTAWFEVDRRGTDQMPLERAAAAVKQMVLLRGDGERLPPLSVALQGIATSVANDYADAADSLLNSEKPMHPKRASASTSPRLPLASGRSDERGRLLWLHPINVLTIAEPSDAARRLAPRFSKVLDVEGGQFAAGVGWSALAASAPTSSDQAVPISLTELHWAYFALYMEIDRGLLDILDQPRWNVPVSLAGLEQDADAVFADYLWVMTARARLDSALVAKGGDELAIWDTIAEVQRFETVVKAVERKLDTLEDLANRRVDQANAYRARRTADGLGYLNVLTLVTVTVAIIGAIFGSRSPGLNSLWVRVLLILIAVLLAAIVYWIVFIRSSRQPRRRTYTPTRP